MLNPVLLAHGLGNTEFPKAKRTTGFTAVTRMHYLCDTALGAFTLSLPANAKPGNKVIVTDYQGTFATNNLTVDPQTKKIRGVVDTYICDLAGVTRTFEYLDDDRGWIVY